MNYTVKLIIPLVLGAAAAAINMMILSARTAPMEFIQATRDIPVGETLTQDLLTVLELPGTVGANLTKTAVPYSQVGMLLNQPTVRELMEGDILFYRDFGLQGAKLNLRAGEVARPLSLAGLSVPQDILTIGNQIKLLLQPGEDEPPRWIGPCRLISVGDRVTNALAASNTASSLSNTIMVAVPANPTTDEQRGVAAALDYYAQRRQSDNARILDVQLWGDH